MISEKLRELRLRALKYFYDARRAARADASINRLAQLRADRELHETKGVPPMSVKLSPPANCPPPCPACRRHAECFREGSACADLREWRALTDKADPAEQAAS